MAGVSDERWEQQNRRTRDVEYVRECIGRFEMEDFGDEVYDYEADGHETVGDRGWHPDTRLGFSSAAFCLIAGGIVACCFIAGVVEAARFLVWAWNATG